MAVDSEGFETCWNPQLKNFIIVLISCVSIVNVVIGLGLGVLCDTAPTDMNPSAILSKPLWICHIVPLGKIDTTLGIVEIVFTQDYTYLEIGVVVWLSIILFKVRHDHVRCYRKHIFPYSLTGWKYLSSPKNILPTLSLMAITIPLNGFCSMSITSPSTQSDSPVS